MRIPTGNFGNVVAEPQRNALIPNDDSIASGMANLGKAASEMGNAIAQADKIKRRTEAAARLATITNDAYDIHDQVKNDVETGVIKPEESKEAFRTRFNAVKGMRLDGIDKDNLQVIDNNLIRLTGKIENSIGDVALKRTRSDIGANLLTMGEQLQRDGMRDLPGAISKFNAAVDTMGPQAGWDTFKITDTKQRFKETTSFNFANATLEGAAQSGDRGLVQSALDRLQGADGEALDPAKRVQLITRAYGYLNGIDASTLRAQEKAQREQEARENAAVTVYNKAFDLWGSGRYMSQAFIAETSAAVTGTAMQEPFLKLVQSQSKVAGFASLSLPQQRAELERMRSAGSDAAVGISPEEHAVYKQFDKITAESERAYKENPWQAAQERGVITDAPAITLNNVQDAQAVLAERMKNIGQVEVAAGRKISPLQPQEAEQIGRLVRSLPPDQQSTALASFGEVAGDGDRIVALANQMAEKDKVLGVAMMYANSRTMLGKYTSEYILRGDRALRDKSIAVDEKRETGWRGDIANQIKGAFPNRDVEVLMIDAAYYIQAALTADGSGDTRRAVLLATGGIVERNGSKIPLPYGWEEDRFGKALRSATADNIPTTDGNVYVGKTAVPVAQFVQQLPQASLEHAGQGLYSVKAGMGYVTDATGKRLVFNIRDFEKR